MKRSLFVIESVAYPIAGLLTFLWFDWKLFVLFILWGCGYISQAWRVSR